MIQFPGLGLKFNIDRVAFNLFGKEIYWYGIIIGCGVLLALAYGIREAKRVGFSVDDLLDLVIYGIIFAIIGARAYYVIFNSATYDSFWDLFKIWEGGIAIYGGLIGAIVAGFVYCKIKKKNFLLALDIAAVPFLIGQAIGRWGNFVNCEAFGSETTLPWRMTIYNEVGNLVSVHPTFLYESLWNVVGIILLVLYRKNKKFTGELFAMYVAWYGLGRFWIEGLRTDSLMLGPIRISQLVALVSAIIAITIIVKKHMALRRSENAAEEEMVVKEAPEPKTDD